MSFFRIILLCTASIFLGLSADAQLKGKLKSFNKDKEEKNTKAKKNGKLSFGERLGNITGNLMTGKTDNLSDVSLMINYLNGIYPVDIKTSETKMMPEGTREGDYVVSVSFMKNEGIGMYELEGTISADGEPMQYVGLGSYVAVFPFKPYSPVRINIQSDNGDEAEFYLETIPEIEIVSVNGEESLPILDLSEDIKLEYYNPEGAEGTDIRLSLITDVTGVRALNHFADFKSESSGIKTVTIPKESLANPEISGDLNVGQFNKGENWLILEREQIINKKDYGDNQYPGNLAASDITVRSFSTFPVIVKGKQEEGLLTSLNVRYKSRDKIDRYDFYKPNANTGIPFSKGSKFGLVSFTVSANTFSQETSQSSSSYSVGGITYTTTTTTTTTYEFPQVPDDYWEYVMESIYSEVTAFFDSEYGIEFIPVEDLTTVPEYQQYFGAEAENTKSKVKMSYKNTLRTRPNTFSEIFANASSNQTADNPTVNMMKKAGDIDGLLSMNLTLSVSGNEDGNVVLIPIFTFSITGRDEDRNDKQGTYINGTVIRYTGEPFNSKAVKSSKEALLQACSFDQIKRMLQDGIRKMREKEIAMGYDRIWNIAEE